MDCTRKHHCYSIQALAGRSTSSAHSFWHVSIQLVLLEAGRQSSCIHHSSIIRRTRACVALARSLASFHRTLLEAAIWLILSGSCVPRSQHHAEFSTAHTIRLVQITHQL